MVFPGPKIPPRYRKVLEATLSLFVILRILSHLVILAVLEGGPGPGPGHTPEESEEAWIPDN